jgi:hypothetical protein
LVKSVGAQPDVVHALDTHNLFQAEAGYGTEKYP